MKIYIQIASYRDRELVPTILDCLNKANNPERLVFGICHQFNPDDKWDDLSRFSSDNRFRIKSVNYMDSMGAGWARSKVNEMYDGEEYTLQIDSHHRFANGWDDGLIDMLSRCDSDKPIITVYPPPYSRETEICKDVFWKMTPKISGDIYRYNSIIREDCELRKHMCFAAGFVFTRGSFITEVPYNPLVYFCGEEISMSIRAWTSGYDMYLPDKNFIWHLYKTKDSDSGRNSHWGDHKMKTSGEKCFSVLDQLSKRYVRKLLSGEDVDFGVGSVRTIAEYEKEVGILFNTSAPNGRINRALDELPLKEYQVFVNWQDRVCEIESEKPDALAVMTSGHRVDFKCGKTIPSGHIFKVNWRVPQKKAIVWMYKENPLRWGKKLEIAIEPKEC